jgi:hypothetical protein
MNSSDASFFLYLAEDDPDDADFEPAASSHTLTKVVYLFWLFLLSNPMSFAIMVLYPLRGCIFLLEVKCCFIVSLKNSKYKVFGFFGGCF